MNKWVYECRDSLQRVKTVLILHKQSMHTKHTHTCKTWTHTHTCKTWTHTHTCKTWTHTHTHVKHGHTHTHYITKLMTVFFHSSLMFLRFCLQACNTHLLLRKLQEQYFCRFFVYIESVSTCPKSGSFTYSRYVSIMLPRYCKFGRG